jgi:hypothetical protein
MSPDTKSEQTGTAAIAQAPTAPTPVTTDHPRDASVRVRDDEAESRARASHHDESAPLFAADEAQQLRAKWDAIQTAFVDEPRRAVENADELVASAMKRLAEVFARERENLEHQWDRGEQISTEDLRVALQRYRSFFTRILRV